MDVSPFLMSLGLGKYVLLFAASGWLTAHLVAWGVIPAPSGSPVSPLAKFYARVVFPALNVVGSANYGQASNSVVKAAADLGITKCVAWLACLGLAVSLSLTACSGAPSVPQNVSQIEQDASLLAGGLQGIATDVQAIPGADATQIAAVQAALTAVQTQIKTFQGLQTPTASDVQTVENVISALGAAAAPFYGSSPLISVAVNAAITLGQTMFAEAGGAGAASGTASAEEARMILAGLEHHG